MTQQEWNTRLEWPLAGASVLFLIAYAWSVIGDVHGPADTILQTVMWLVWVLFVADYAVNLALAKPRWRWFYGHTLDLLIVVLPFLRPLRLIRLLALFGVLHRAVGRAFRGKVTIYVIVSASLIIFVAAVAVLDSEQNQPGAHIRSFGDALWWAFTTISTVGYGDFTPITPVGRLVAVGLMISGVALLGAVTATLASWFVERVQDTEVKAQQLTRAHINEVTAELRALRAEFASLTELIAPRSAAPDDVVQSD
jgi:voltage-gated potassium channel